jgi:predicted nucleic acid-binding protein
MIVIADTSPLNYLIQIEAADVLQALYGRVIVPQAVVDELEGGGAPSAVRSWISQPPGWLEMLPDPPSDPMLQFLDKGESAAVTLAQALHADKLLIDDKSGRIEAERRNLNVTGTVGVLADAHLSGLLDFDQAVSFLRSTNFRLHPDVERAVRHRLYGQGEKRSI